MRNQSNFQQLWVSPDAKFPDTCMTCGMFTDARITTRFVGKKTEIYEEKERGSLGLGCLFFFLGPLGTILSLVQAMRSRNKPGELRTREVTAKSKLKVPQCELCSSEQKIVPLDGDVDAQLYAFSVHPRFVENYQRANPAVEPDVNQW